MSEEKKIFDGLYGLAARDQMRQEGKMADGIIGKIKKRIKKVDLSKNARTEFLRLSIAYGQAELDGNIKESERDKLLCLADDFKRAVASAPAEEQEGD